jgi:cytoskeleton protein RodZ
VTAGAAWKAKREALGKSVEDISSELRISPKYIEAMESGQFEGWPARVFAQGFIRSYASLLGTDPEPLIAEYGSQQAAEPPLEEAPPHGTIPIWRSEESGRGRRSLWYGAIALFLIAAAAVVSYLAGIVENAPPPPAPAPAAPRPAAQAAPAAPPVAGTPQGLPPADNGATRILLPPDNAAGSVSSLAGASLPKGAEEGFAPVPPAGPYHLRLEAAEETWVSWSVDDGKSSEATLAPGEKLDIPARTRIQLRLGNAGGVAPSVNGRRTAPFGRRGQVKSLLIGPPPPGTAEPLQRKGAAVPAASLSAPRPGAVPAGTVPAGKVPAGKVRGSGDGADPVSTMPGSRSGR